MFSPVGSWLHLYILYELGYGVDVEEDVVYCTTSHRERKSI